MREPVKIDADSISLVTPELLYDGLWTIINKSGSGQLIFYKNLNNNLDTDPENYKGETVARLHFDNLEELKSISNQIDGAIKNHKNKEP